MRNMLKGCPRCGEEIEGANPKMKANEYRIVVKGCIRGRRLHASALETSDSIFRTLRATDFALSGSKELLQQIKDQHDGHWDEVEGTANAEGDCADAPDGRVRRALTSSHLLQ
jgi:hypothetical protein